MGALSNLVGVLTGVVAAGIAWHLGFATAVPASPSKPAAPTSPCSSCGAGRKVVLDEELFSPELNRMRRWLPADLPQQSQWTVADAARLIDWLDRGPPASGEEEAGLVRAWSLLAVGRRLAEAPESVSGCAALLSGAVERNLASSSARVRYAAATALSDIRDAGRPIDLEALRALEADPDPAVARLVRWRLGSRRS